MSLVLSDHARQQAARRGIDESTLRSVAASPEQTLTVRPGREVRQSRVRSEHEGVDYLIRVIVDVATDPETVVTVYRTSKIDKYWRTP